MPNCSMRPLEGSGFVAIHSHPPIATRGEQILWMQFFGGFRFCVFTMSAWLQYLYAEMFSQWFTVDGWKFIQGVLSGRGKFEMRHQAKSLVTLATCHTPPLGKRPLCDSL